MKLALLFGLLGSLHVEGYAAASPKSSDHTRRTEVRIVRAASLTLMAVFFATPCTNLLAKDVSLTAQFSACVNKSGGVTSSLIECISAETQRQDARLNKAYQTLVGLLGADRRRQLQGAQRAWIRFRDTNCAFYMDAEGGSLARLSANDCVMSMTANRAEELETFLR